MTVAELISKFLSHYTLWQLYCPSYYLHMTVIWEYKTRVELRGCVESVGDVSYSASSCPWWNRNRCSVSKLNLPNISSQTFQRSVLWSFWYYAISSSFSVFIDFECFFCLFIWIVGWMFFPRAWTPWAPSRQRTLTAWRSSSSIMTSTTAGIWQQRLTGIMRTVQHASLSAHALRLLQVRYTSGLTNFHACRESKCTYTINTVSVRWWLTNMNKSVIFETEIFGLFLTCLEYSTIHTELPVY